MCWWRTTESFAIYFDKKILYPVQVSRPKFQVHHIDPKLIQLHKVYGGATNNGRWFLIIITHREIKTTADWEKVTEVSVIWEWILFVFNSNKLTILSLNYFMQKNLKKIIREKVKDKKIMTVIYNQKLNNINR